MRAQHDFLKYIFCTRYGNFFKINFNALTVILNFKFVELRMFQMKKIRWF